MDNNEPPEGIARIMLLDLDNCPRELLQLAKSADQYQFIVACHGSAEPKVPLGMATVIGELIAAGKMQIVRMKQGKNAADFGLTFWAGRLSAMMPDALFFIASKDKDLDFATDMLRKQGCSAKRIPTTAEATLSSNNNEAFDVDQALINNRKHVISFCDMLVRKKDTLPRKRTALANFARSTAPKNHDWTKALELLEKERLVTYNDKDVVQYHHQRLPGIVKRCCSPTTTQNEPDGLMEKLKINDLPKTQISRTQQNCRSQETSFSPGDERQRLLFDITDPANDL